MISLFIFQFRISNTKILIQQVVQFTQMIISICIFQHLFNFEIMNKITFVNLFLQCHPVPIHANLLNSIWSHLIMPFVLV